MAGIVAAAVVTAACGSGGDDGVGSGGDASVTFVSSEARWIDTTEALDEFDVTVQKTDPTVLGVEAVWTYTVEGDVPLDDLRIRPELRAGVVIDGQSTDGEGQLGGASSRFDRKIGDMRLVPTDDGFKIEFIVGNLLGASDLQSQEEFDEFMADAGVDVDDAPIRFAFIEDRDTPGVLDYRIVLSGTVEVDGNEIELNDGIEFVAIESDPDAVRVDDDDSAIAAADAANVAETGECVPLAISADDTSFTIAAPDDVTVSGPVPAGWSVEFQEMDPCDQTGLGLLTSADSRSSDFSVLVMPATGEDARAFAERRVVDSNLSFDDEGNEITLGPGDEFYTGYAPIDEAELAGLPGVRVIGEVDYGEGSVITTNELIAVAGDHAIIVYYSYFDTDDLADLVPTLLDGLTITEL
ncbi:MAG: hypothetical protein AAFY28_10190 [Actinomycetota bacterium]